MKRELVSDIDRLRLAIDNWGLALVNEIQLLREAIIAINIDRKTEPQTYITEDRDTQILDAWQVKQMQTERNE